MGIAEEIYGSVQTWTDVKKWVEDKQPESRNIDFKTTKFMRGDERLPKDDEIHVSRSLSGFSNVDGGVLVFGVATVSPHGKSEPDCASELKPVPDVQRFHGLVQRKLVNCTMPPVAGLDSKVVEADSPGEGAILILVPASEGGPHRTQGIDAAYNDKYYMRTSTNTVPMDHQMLAAKFSRRLPPDIRVVLAQKGPHIIEIALENMGRGGARSVVTEVMAQGAWFGQQDLFDRLGPWEHFPEHHGQGTETCVFVARPGFVLFAGSMSRIGTVGLPVMHPLHMLSIRVCADDTPPISVQCTRESLPVGGLPMFLPKKR